MGRLADLILHLHGWAALLVVFAVPALESSAFLGFLFPGEVAVLLGGVLAFEHRVTLPGALVAAIAGAVIGDSVGFEVGRRWGRTLLRGTIGRFVKQDHLDRAERYLAERGGKAVFFGRFTAALRVLIPGMAGMSGMPYRTFAMYNVAGGALWAGGFVVLGFVAGNGYKHFEKVAKQASVLLLLGAVAIALAVFAARWAIRHRGPVEAFGRRQLARPRVVRVRERYGRQLGFLSRRLRPGGARGLALTVALAALMLAGWALGVVVANVLRRGGVVGTDQPILDFFVQHRTSWLTQSAKVVSDLGATWVLAPLVALIGAAFRWRRGTWRPLLVLAAAQLGALVLWAGVGQLVARARPAAVFAAGRYGGFSFPSGHATEATAFWGALALVLSGATSSWTPRVVAWTLAIVVAGLVGVTRCYLGAVWASDVAGAWAAGAVWLFVVAVVVQASAVGESGITGGPSESGRPS